MRKISFIFAGVLAIALAAPTVTEASRMACEDDSGLCLESLKGARWVPGKSTTRKQRKKQSNKRAGTISMEVDGRGSLFINGRYAGTSPLSGAKIPGGPNDIQIRDGARVLAEGILVVPRNGDVSITVAGAE